MYWRPAGWSLSRWIQPWEVYVYRNYRSGGSSLLGGKSRSRLSPLTHFSLSLLPLALSLSLSLSLSISLSLSLILSRHPQLWKYSFGHTGEYPRIIHKGINDENPARETDTKYWELKTLEIKITLWNCAARTKKNESGNKFVKTKQSFFMQSFLEYIGHYVYFVFKRSLASSFLFK